MSHRAAPTGGRSRMPASSPDALRRMKAVRRRGTGPETALRSALHRMGFRYRVQVRVLKGGRRSADVWFPVGRVAVFIDGCFWHGCPLHGTTPKANQAFWAAKIAANRERDLDTNRRLSEAGCLVVRVWEHEDAGGAAARVAGPSSNAGRHPPVTPPAGASGSRPGRTGRAGRGSG